ncbi:MAG TPA: response regulator [Candidatus Paceibacterota bacterium]|nr:response regulator [Candidatus Paceibacterota bacterium]
MPEGQIKVLIVEDDRFLSSIVKNRLERDGFLVAQAYDGDDGLKKLPEFRPDLIILDLIMPKMSGFEFMEALAADPEFNQIPVLIASNLGQESDIEKAKNLGAVDYYVKVRTSIDDLDKMIKNVVTQRYHIPFA